MKEDIIPCLSWNMGVVDQPITGHDKAVRGAIIHVKSKNTKETTFIKRPLQLTASLEADQLETKTQEPVHGQFGSKRIAAINADAIRRLIST